MPTDHTDDIVDKNEHDGQMRYKQIIGNYNYMAPEVIMGEGYSFEVDYWSAGVIMYECIIGHLPFVGDKEDPMSIYFAIINGKLNFPQNFESKPFEFLINSMLAKNPSKRLAKIELIQTQQFFNGFNWDNIQNIKPTLHLEQ